MSLVPFDSLPGDARLWCFGTSRPPDPTETAHLLDAMQSFVQRWTAHQEDLRAGVDWRLHRFLLIGLDESASVEASGCSIDALTRRLRALEEELDLELLDSSRVWYRDRLGVIVSCERPEFRRRAASGEVDESTPVFDVTLSRVAELRAGRLEQPAGTAWHRSLVRRD